MSHKTALLLFAIIYTAAMLIGGSDDYALAIAQDMNKQQMAELAMRRDANEH